MAEPLPPLPPGFKPVPDSGGAPAELPPLPPGFKPAPEEPKPSMWESFGRGNLEGATFGLDAHMGADKARRELSRETNPWMHFLGEVTGGLAPMTAAYLLPTGVGQAAAAGRTAQMVGRAARLLRGALVPGEITSTANAVGQGAKLGASYGALSGAGHSDSLSDVPWNAASGAAQGAPFGAAMGAAGRLAYRGFQGLGTILSRATDETAPGQRGALITATKRLEQDRITPQELMERIWQEFPDPTAAPGVPGQPLARRFWGPMNPYNQRRPWTRDQVEMVVDMALNQNMSALQISRALPLVNGMRPGDDAVRSLLAELGERHLGPLNILDRAGMVRTGSGDNTQMGMRVAAATSGEARTIARERFLERQIGTNDRIHDAIDRWVGNTDYDAVAAQHQQRLDTTADHLYGLARQHERPFDLNPIVDQWRTDFANMRGVVPDGINRILDQFTTPNAGWQQQLAGAIRPTQPAGAIPNRAAPIGLDAFIYARQRLQEAIDGPQGWIQGPSGWKRTQLGAQLNTLKQQLSDEVRRTNPRWGVANDIFAEGSAGNNMLMEGARLPTRINAQSRSIISGFTRAQRLEAQARQNLANATTPAEQAWYQGVVDAAQTQQDLFRVGVARALSDHIMNRGETHDLVTRLLYPGSRQILEQVLGPNHGPRFVAQLRAEQAIFRTYKAQFGSQTTPLAEGIREDRWAPQVDVSLTNPMSWAGKLGELIRDHMAETIRANRNTRLMEDVYTTQDPVRQLRLLRQMQRLHRTRSNAGNISGVPIVGASGPLMDAALGDENAQPPRRP